MGHILYPSVHTREGDGAEVNRLFPVPGRLMNYDPFVLWDNFRIRPGAGFPSHPHRGFEAITYLFAGAISHEDNLGNRSTVTAGGAQRFTAGKGIVHSEMPGNKQESHGIQLWINLPQHLKGIDPDYQEVATGDIPQLDFEGVSVRHIVGNDSPLRLHTEVIYREIRLEQGADYSFEMPATHKGFVYLIDGELTLGSTQIPAVNACFLEPGQAHGFHAGRDSHFMICSGTPHHEPIHQHGPFVD
jgi:redox-sensitive bicupin YhaK (pirin superfamily)